MGVWSICWAEPVAKRKPQFIMWTTAKVSACMRAIYMVAMVTCMYTTLPSVFNVLLVAALKNMAAFLDHHQAQGKQSSKRLQLRSMVRQYLKDLVVVS